MRSVAERQKKPSANGAANIEVHPMGGVAHPPHLANTALTNFPPILPNFFQYHVSCFFAPTVQGLMQSILHPEYFQ